MNSPARIEIETDPVARAAAEWLTRLPDPNVPLDTVAGWQAWMNADARHAEAFGQIEDLWRDFAALPCPETVPAKAMAADGYDASMSIGRWKARAGRIRAARLALAASLAAISLVGMALWQPWKAFGGEMLQTGIGQNRTVMLQDGSSVVLGGDSKVRLSFSAKARELTLVRGEAFFDVARDKLRPFSVQAGPTRVVAIGTQFNVRRNDDDRVVVSVVEGEILVLGAGRAKVHESLSAGSRATLGGAGREPARTERVVSTDATAWRSGRLAFESEPLRYVVEDVNRYSARPIELADERIGDLLITGTVRDDNISAWLASLEPAFGIRVVEEPERVVLEIRP